MASSQKNLFNLIIVFCAFITVNSQKTVVDLNEENWTEILQNEWMVELWVIRHFFTNLLSCHTWINIFLSLGMSNLRF